MKLPIVAYGDPVLKKLCTDIDQTYPDLQQLVQNMFETMYNASGVGLAAPQVNLPIRLFIVEIKADEEEPAYKKVFINAQILEETGEPWAFNEGCLSIPDVREDVIRKPNVLIRYYDENWTLHEEVVTGFPARVIQHEFDHIEGKLFTDKLSLLRRQMLKGKLDNIAKGKVHTDYKMRFPKQNKKR
jgi:peptide deformylase